MMKTAKAMRVSMGELPEDVPISFSDVLIVDGKADVYLQIEGEIAIKEARTALEFMKEIVEAIEKTSPEDSEP